MSAIEQLPRHAPDVVAEQMRSRLKLLQAAGSELYPRIAERLPDDPELVAIAARGLGMLPELHLFVAVHYLLMCDPSDPLAQYYATLTKTPAPAKDAFADFRRYCLRHRDEILDLFKTRTIQLTHVARCQAIMSLLSYVADRAGEPLNLLEIGCSAGLLLAFDKFAYVPKGRGRIGAKNAALTLEFDVHGGPELRIPSIGKRVGLDLRLVDVKLADERRWLLAQYSPDGREGRDTLATALDAVARTDIEFLEGDALDLLPRAIANSTGPLCVFHSACVCYWSDESREKLDALLRAASRGRDIWRASMEPDLQKAAQAKAPSDVRVDNIVTHYRDGVADSKVVFKATSDNLTFTWLV